MFRKKNLTDELKVTCPFHYTSIAQYQHRYCCYHIWVNPQICVNWCRQCIQNIEKMSWLSNVQRNHHITQAERKWILNVWIDVHAVIIFPPHVNANKFHIGRAPHPKGKPLCAAAKHKTRAHNPVSNGESPTPSGRIWPLHLLISVVHCNHAP